MNEEKFKKEFAKKIVKELKENHYVDDKKYFEIANELSNEFLINVKFLDMLELSLNALLLIKGDVYTKVDDNGNIFVFDNKCPATKYIEYNE